MKTITAIQAACLLVGIAAGQLWAGPDEKPTTAPASRPAGKLSDRASCSSLCQLKAPTEEVLKTVAGLGYRWVDLSALTWAPHVSAKALLDDFDKETMRVDAALKAAGVRISNLTYDSFDGRPFDEYRKELEVLAKFAAHEKARLINIMAPSNKMPREEAAEKLKALVDVAKGHGVILTIETHVGQITEHPADALWLCKQVPGLGLTLDPSHYYAGPHEGKLFDELYPYVQGTGLRAGGRTMESIQSPWGTGPINFEKIIRDLEKAGYKGFYETEYLEGMNQLNAVEEARKFLAWMKKL